MKKIHFMLALMVMTVMLAACSEKKKSNDIITPRIVEVTPKAPVEMQENTDSWNVEWIGKNYHIAIHRHASDSLPMVQDETGQKFVDNVFRLSVQRPDGSFVIQQTFTKKDFTKYIDENFRKSGILEGLVFDRVDGDNLVFAGSVGLPQTDEYIPLVIRLSRMGNLDIRRDTQMDTPPEEKEPAKDEDEGV